MWSAPKIAPKLRQEDLIDQGNKRKRSGVSELTFNLDNNHKYDSSSHSIYYCI